MIRTLLLMNLATRVFADQNGNIYLLEIDRSQSSEFRSARMIHNQSQIDEMARAEIAIMSLLILSSLAILAVFLMLARPAAFAIIALLLSIDLGAVLKLKRSLYPGSRVPKVSLSGLTLTPVPEVLRVSSVREARWIALALGILCLCISFLSSADTYVERGQISASISGLSFAFLFFFGRIVIDGGWVLNRNSLTVGDQDQTLDKPQAVVNVRAANADPTNGTSSI